MKKNFPIFILTLVSALLIFYRFTEIPKYLAFDEVEFAKLALSLQNKPYTAYSTLATGHSTIYFYILLASLKTFGINVFALRFPAAVFGIISVLMFCLIMKIVFRKQHFHLTHKTYHIILIPYLLSLIFLTSRWFLNFARFSFEATFLLFLELTSIYFFLKFDEMLKAKRPDFLDNRQGPPWGCGGLKNPGSSFYLIMSGLFAGFAFLSYTPGRIFFLLPLSFIILSFPRRSSTLRHSSLRLEERESSVFGSPIRSGMTLLLYFLIPFMIIITPLTSYLLKNKDTRIDQQFFLKNNEMTINKKASGLWHNISSTTLMFFTKGDVNGRHNYPGKPALNPILGILFIIGLIISIKNWRNPINSFFIFYFLLSIFPALMTYPWENPNMLRTYTVLPSVIYFIGNAIYHLCTIVPRWSLNKKIPKYLILSTLYFILISSCFYELRTYFKYQSTVFKQSFEIKLPLEKAVKIKLKP